MAVDRTTVRAARFASQVDKEMLAADGPGGNVIIAIHDLSLHGVAVIHARAFRAEADAVRNRHTRQRQTLQAKVGIEPIETADRRAALVFIQGAKDETPLPITTPVIEPGGR